MVELTAILTTYNRAALLDRVMEGVASQTLAPERYELVVIDDGSADNTREVVGRYADRLPMRYLYQANAGLAAARNHGLAVARAPVVLFMDDDDRIEPQTLLAHLETHRKHPEPEVAVLGYTQLAADIASDILMHYVTQIQGHLFWYRGLEKRGYLGFDYFWGGRTSCKRDFVLKVGGFNPVFRFGCEDIELGYRLAGRGLKVLHNPRAVSTMLRAIGFDAFCNRLLRQGRSQYIVSRLFPDDEIQAWCEMPMFHRDWPSMAPRLQEILERGRALDSWVRHSLALGLPVDDEVRGLLHSAYSEAFKASKLSGIAEVRESWTGPAPARPAITASPAAQEEHSPGEKAAEHAQDANVDYPFGQLLKQFYYRSLFGRSVAARRATKLVARYSGHLSHGPLGASLRKGLTSRRWLAKQLIRRSLRLKTGNITKHGGG